MQTIPSYSEEFYSTLTQKGQVTIPVEVRRLLDIKPREKVAFVVEKDQVRVKRGRSVVERTAGIFKTNMPPLSAKELREAAEIAIAEAALERSGV